jgi:glycosyltransferase involved in cell wall biosynthesis
LSAGEITGHQAGPAALVLHVIPTPAARGAQREARALADQLDAPGVRHHRVLGLFDGPPEVVVDYSLAFPAGDHPASGFDVRLVSPLRRELKRLDPDVVVAHGSDTLKYLVPALIGRPTRLVYYAIGTYAGSPDRRLQLELWRFLSARADVVAACGEEVRQECLQLLKRPAGRVTAVSNGRDPQLFHPRESVVAGGEPVVTFVGALARTKRPGRFVEMVAALRKAGHPLRAQIIGDGPLRDELVAPAKDAGVELLGLRADVPALLRAADVIVFPSLPAGEGMPGVLIEAGLSGVPVVATAVPGVRTILDDGETGLVVGIDDFEALVTATATLLAEPQMRADMGAAARERCAERFSLTEVAAGWLSVLQPLLRSPRP